MQKGDGRRDFVGRSGSAKRRGRGDNRRKAGEGVFGHACLGYKGASISDLTGATGLATPSLYAAFGSKRGFFLAALDRYAATLGAGPVRARCGPGAGSVRALAEAAPGGKAAALAEAAVALCFPEGRPRGCLLACAGPEAAAEDEGIRDHARKLIDETIAAFDQARAGSALPDGEFLLAALHAAAIRARTGTAPAEVRALLDKLLAPATLP